MATVVQRANDILKEKIQDIKPENIKQGVQIFDIIGTLDPGTDTSDATATSEDILKDKIAYVKNEKITGTLPLVDKYEGENPFVSVEEDAERKNKKIALNSITPNRMAIEKGSPLILKATENQIANAIDLKPTQIKQGEKVLGIEGVVVSSEDFKKGTATTDDIALEKTAIVQGNEIVGKIPTVERGQRCGSFEKSSSITRNETEFTFIGSKNGSELLRDGSEYEIGVDQAKIAKEAGITPEKIVRGNTILTISGSAVSNEKVFFFNTKEELLATVGKENDIGIIYDSILEDVKDVYQYNLGEWHRKLVARFQSKTIEAVTNGYKEVRPDENYDGLSSVKVYTKVPGVDSTADATVEEDDVAEGKKAYARGGPIIGTLKEEKGIIEIGPQNISIEDNKKDTLTFKTTNTKDKIYRRESEIKFPISYPKMAETLGIKAENIKEGTQILGVNGTLANLGYNTADANVLATDIIEGRIAYGKNGKVVGVIPEVKGTAKDTDIFDDSNAVVYDKNIFKEQITFKKDFLGRANTSVTLFTPESSIAYSAGIKSKDVVGNKTILGIKGTAPIMYESFVEMTEDSANVEPGALCITFEGKAYLGTYRLNEEKTWVKMGGASDNETIMSLLNQIDLVYEPYEGPGGTDQEIGAKLDELGNPIQQ